MINIHHVFLNYQYFLAKNRDYSYVPEGAMFYSRTRLLCAQHLSVAEFICCCMISGNDFVPRIKQANELSLSSFDSIISYVKKQNLKSSKECAEFYHSLNPTISVCEVESMLALLL